MKQIIGILSLMLVIGCQSSSTPVSSKYKTVMIKSCGEVETLPNIATFQVNLSCLEKSITASKNCIVEKSNEMNKQLLAYGIQKDDLLTTAVNLNKSYTWQNGSRVFEGYKSSTTVFVTVRNIEKLDEIYTGLLENEHVDLGGLNYSHSKLDSLKNEAYIDALEKASILTDKLLEKLPEENKEILKIGNVEISSSMPEPNANQYNSEMIVSSREANSPSISINKGTVIVNATLFVEYQIK